MTLSSLSGSPLTQSQLSNQKNIAEPNKNDASRSNSASENNYSGNKIDDNVTLSKSEKSSESSKALGTSAAEELLPQAIKAILADSGQALSAQANIKPEAAIELLATS